MTKKKTNTPNNNIKIMILLLLFLGLTVLGLNYYTKNSAPPEQSEIPPQVDTANDGVYTNYQYGFSFEYPSEIFKISDPGGMGFYEKKFVPGEVENNWVAEGMWLGVQIVPADNSYFQVLNEEMSLKLNQYKYSNDYLYRLPIDKRPLENVVKVKEYQDGFLINTYSMEWAEIEPFYGFKAVWKRNGYFIEVYLYDNKKTKNQQLDIITKIIDSMDFFENTQIR